jgi:hypothetical protein
MYYRLLLFSLSLSWLLCNGFTRQYILAIMAKEIDSFNDLFFRSILCIGKGDAKCIDQGTICGIIPEVEYKVIFIATCFHFLADPGIIK